MTDQLRQAAQQALEALERYQVKRQDFDRFADEITALRTALEQQAEPVSHAAIAGALFDFMGWLTTRKERLVLSSVDNASPAADAIKAFAEMRGLSLDDARVQDWNTSLPQQQAEPTCPECKAAVLYECVACSSNNYPPKQQAEPVAMRLPKVGDKVICLEDESFGTVESLTAGGSPDIKFDDGSRGTYLLREFAELFSYAEQRQQQAEPVFENLDYVAVVYSPSNAMLKSPLPIGTHLYKYPPQRQWVGLTDKDFLEACQIAERGNYLVALQRIQIKLKERNT